MAMRRPRLAWAIGLLGLVFAAPARSEIVMVGRDASGNLVPSSSPNAGRNLNPAPFGLGDDVGQVGIGSGVAIAPQYVLTAKHVGTNSFVFKDGGPTATTYATTFVASEGDLSVYKVADPTVHFTHYATIYTGSSELNQSLVSIGYGYGRGPEVDTPGTSKLAGWNWNYVADNKQSWGTNTINAILNATDISQPPSFGQYLRFSFDKNGNPDQVILSGGDSGGATFIKDPSNGMWKLAGINGDIDSVYVKGSTAADPKYADALFDARGFYSDANATMLITGTSAVPMSSYAQRLSDHQAFLAPYIRSVPEPGSLALLAVGLGGCAYAGWRQHAARGKSK